MSTGTLPDYFMSTTRPSATSAQSVVAPVSAKHGGGTLRFRTRSLRAWADMACSARCPGGVPAAGGDYFALSCLALEELGKVDQSVP